MDYRVVLLSKTLHEQLLWDSRIPSESRTIAKPVLKREINNVDTFSFTVYKTHPLYDKLTPYNGWVAVKKNGKVKFIGKITQAPDNIRHEKQVQCEGGLALLKHSAYSRYMPNWCPKAYDKKVSPFSVTDSVEKMVNRVIDIHNAQVYEGTADKWEDGFPCVRLGVCTARENPYGVDLVKSAGNEGTQNEGLYITRDQTSCTTPYDWLTSEVCEKCAAYAIMEVGDDYSLTLNIYGAKELPANTTTPIRFEKNLLDMSLDVDFSDVCTVFLPLGESNSNVGTLLGNDQKVSTTEGDMDMSFGDIIKSAVKGTLLTDISEAVNGSIADFDAVTETEISFNTLEMNGNSDDIMKDAALTYQKTSAYDSRQNKDLELATNDDGTAVMFTYYKEDTAGDIISDVTYMLYTDIGYVDPVDEDLVIHSTNGNGYIKVSVPVIGKLTNCYVGDIDFSRNTMVESEAANILYYFNRDASIELWRQKKLTNNYEWENIASWRRSRYTYTPAVEPDYATYSTVVESYKKQDINYVPGLVTDIVRITPNGYFSGETNIAQASKDRIMFRGSNEKDTKYAGMKSDMRYCFVASKSGWRLYDGTVNVTYTKTSGTQFPQEWENHLVRLPARNSVLVRVSALDDFDNVDNHMSIQNVGDTGLGWIETVDNTGIFTNASVDGVTIRANYPYLEWVEGIERYGRIVKTHTWSSARRSQLRQYAPAYFCQKILEAETINANAVDIGLSDIETGMSYKVICEQMGKKQWYPCLKSEENLMDPTKNKFTFTYKHPTFTQEVMKIAKNVSSANRRLPATVLKSVGGVALSENPQ